MTQADFACTKDARVALSGSTELGSGTSDGLPYGTYSGYRYRALLGFNINMAGWTSITSALFYYRSSDQIHVAFGSDPTFLVQRLTTAWSEGSSSGLSASNAVIYPGPSADGTHQVIEDAPTGEDAWGSVDITLMMRDVLSGAPFTGLRLLGTDNAGGETGDPDNVGEIYSRESGSGTAYIRIVYTTGLPPIRPVVTSTDVVNGFSASLTPTLSVEVVDPDGANLTQYHYQVDDNPDWVTPLQQAFVSGSWPSGASIPFVPTTLTRGVTYYFRVQAKNATQYGGWSVTYQFKVASLPTLTVSEPSATGRLARLTYVPGSGWASPRMVVNWALACPDGGSQASWRVVTLNDSGGVPGSGHTDTSGSDGTSALVVNGVLVEGSYYHVQVTATCSHGLQVSLGLLRVRTRWGVVTHRHDMVATTLASLALTVLDVTDETKGGSGRAVVEYMTTAASTTPGVWSDTVGGAGLRQYFWYRAWLLAWGVSPAVSPTLNQLKIAYSTGSITPDKWVYAGGGAGDIAGDVSSFVYGTKSLRMKGIGATALVASQQIAVTPGTKYMVSARVQTSGTIAARIALATSATGPDVLLSEYQAPDIAFSDPRSRISIGPWDSGNSTSIFVRLYAVGEVGSTAWFDIVKVEASLVVTPWSPGYVSDAVVLDSGGLQVDATKDGTLRLLGHTGGARDEVSLGDHGLRFGGDTELWSPSDGALVVDGTLLSLEGHSHGSSRPMGAAFPGSPAIGDLFFHTGYMMEFMRVAGPRWLCTCPHTGRSNDIVVLNATTANIGVIAPPAQMGNADAWLEDWEVAYLITGGSALSATIKWDVVLQKVVLAGGASTITTKTISSGAIGAWRRDAAIALDQLATTPAIFQLSATKTGAVGTLTLHSTLTYRIIGT